MDSEVADPIDAVYMNRDNRLFTERYFFVLKITLSSD